MVLKHTFNRKLLLLLVLFLLFCLFFAWSMFQENGNVFKMNSAAKLVFMMVLQANRCGMENFLKKWMITPSLATFMKIWLKQPRAYLKMDALSVTEFPLAWSSIRARNWLKPLQLRSIVTALVENF